ncbi:unnamed protein product [Calicophoron daubneyi]|uniref:Uncharacterized protein n=1 Tax=Calicophoron daubneyi TaxID=300641 RepID=A0AAV2TTN7_CALDB
MQKHPEREFLPWGSGMLTGIDVICRSKVPIVPELSQVCAPDPTDFEFEYDFLHERQTIADHDQYLDQKRKLASEPPKPVELATSKSPVPGQVRYHLAVSTTEVKVSTLATTSNPVTSIATPPPVYYTGQHIRLPYSTVRYPAPLPVAARQLVSGSILQPSRTKTTRPSDLQNSTSNLPDGSHNATLHNTSVNGGLSDTKNNRISPYLRDFDTGPDDPFASAELKTINDLEELRSVLSSSAPKPVVLQPAANLLLPGNRTSSPRANSFSQIPAEFSPQLHASGPQTVSGRSSPMPLGYSMLPPVTSLCSQSSLSDVYKAVTSVADTNSRSFTSAYNMWPTNSYTGGQQTNDCGDRSPSVQRQSLSASVPNLQTVVECPNSVVDNAMHCQRMHRTVPIRPVSVRGLQPPTFRHAYENEATLGIPTAEQRENKKTSVLISWALSNGFSGSRARRLIDLQRTRPGEASMTLEQAKTELLNQLRSVDILLSERFDTQGNNRLSENSALAAVTAFPRDLTKARQFAKVTVELEKYGYPQELIQSFVLASDLNPEDTISKIRAHFIHSNADGQLSQPALLGQCAHTHSK